jgi:hypothetical protein
MIAGEFIKADDREGILMEIHSQINWSSSSMTRVNLLVTTPMAM